MVSNLKFDESIPGLVLAITSMILCDMMYPHGVQAANIFCKASNCQGPRKITWFVMKVVIQWKEMAMM
jgi:hypothetical protein